MAPCSVYSSRYSQKKTLTRLHTAVVLHPRPHQPAHQALGNARPDAEVHIGSVGAPEQTVVGGFFDFGDLRMHQRQLQREHTRQPRPEAAMP